MCFSLFNDHPGNRAPGVRGSAKVSKDLADVNRWDNVDVIVQFRNGGTEAELAKVAQHGGKQKKKLKQVKAALFSLPASEIQKLAGEPEVEFISKDRTVRSTLDKAVATIGADFAWRTGQLGTGIGVAVIDSGIEDTVGDLRGGGRDQKDSRIVYGETFINGAKEWKDDYGHGTHIAGVIAGNGADSVGKDYKVTLSGIAPGVHLINLKVLDKFGQGKDSDVIEAIERAIQLKKTYNIRVINLSLGHPVFESFTKDPLCLAVEKAWKAGIVVVVAAGNEGRNNSFANDGYGTISGPGNSPYVITVGAMNMRDTATRSDDVIAELLQQGSRR